MNFVFDYFRIKLINSELCNKLILLLHIIILEMELTII